MADIIDELKVQIEAGTSEADAKIDQFIQKMAGLQKVISGLEMSGTSQVASGINQISNSVQNFSQNTKTADFTRIARGLNKLAEVDVQSVSDVSRAMSTFATNLSGIGSMDFDSMKFTEIADSITKLGRASASDATSNLESLKTSVADFITGLNRTNGISFNMDNLISLVNSVSKLGGTNATQSVKNLPKISKDLQEFVSGMNRVGSLTFDFTGVDSLLNSISRLGGSKATQAAKNLEPIKKQILRFVSGLNGIGSVKFDVSSLSALISSISKLGGKSVTNAVPNIEKLTVALNNMMQTLSNAPMVSQNLIQMTNAMANLAGNGNRISSASRSLASGINTYSRSTNRATKGTKGLVSQISMFYAKCFLLIRGIKSLWKATESSMDYIETVNYFDSAWGQVADAADLSWEKAGYSSAEAYAKSFSERAKQLTAKMAGFRADENGNLVATGMPSLGLDPEKTMNYQATFGQMASSMGVASETALQLSNALTMIGADLASVKNLNFDDVWQDMASGMVGMSRTLDKYGVNIRNVNLQQKLNELGIKANISALNQQDKALLRTIILLDSTRYAWGDMANTISQPANSLRLLQANFANLARTLGNLFLPVVSKVLPYINALVIALQRLFSWIGGLLGIKVGGFSSSIGSAAADMSDMEDAAGGVADSTGDAAKNAKKMADNLQAFDKLNVISSTNDSGSGGAGGAGGGVGDGLLDDAFLDAFSEYQKAWDAAFANMENTAQGFADRICNAFERVWETAEPTREALKRLWDEGLARLGNFVWTGLKDFYTEFLLPVGKWTLGTGLPMLVDNINAFLLKIDFPAINDALRNFWQALTPFATKVGEGLIDFFGDLLSVGADFINYIVPNGFNNLAGALREIDPDTAEKIGYALGIVATGIMGFKTLAPMVTTLESVAKSMKKWDQLKSTFKFLGAVKYLAIAAGVAGLILALDKFDVIDVDWDSLADGFKNLASALGKFVSGIGNGLINFIKGISPIVSPALEVTINGMGSAFEFFAKVLNAIPASAISTLTTVLLDFFSIWAATTAANKILEITKHLYNMKDAYSLLIELHIEQFKETLWSFFTSLSAHPYAAIAAGIYLVAKRIMSVTEEAAKSSAIGQFSQALGELNDTVSLKTAEINSSLENTRSSIETAGQAESQMARDLAKEYEELSEKASLSAYEKERLRDVSKNLVEIIPSLQGYIDDETGALDIQKESLDAVIQGYESLAQKQAAQEYLVQAYKDQYDAQMNLNRATNGWNDLADEFISNNEGMSETVKELVKAGDIQALKDLKNQVYDINGSTEQLQYWFGESAINGKAVDKMLDNLAGTMSEYEGTVQDAKDTLNKANEEIVFANNAISDAEESYRKCTEVEKAAILASDEYQQSLKDLNTEFSNLDLTLSDDLLQNLALDSLENGFNTSSLQKFFDSLADGVPASAASIKDAFENLGLTLPNELANALSTKETDVQRECVKMLMGIQSGLQANESQLQTLFANLGISLPESLISNLASKEANVQTETINLLTKIENGYSLTEGGLKTIFSTLGVQLPESIISSLASKNADVQEQAIELLGQISAAEESERPKLIEKLEALGVTASGGLNTGLASNNDEIKETAKTMVKNVKDPIENEFSSSSSGSMYDAGANASKGFWQGVKDWWDDTWLGKKIDEFKTTVTGPDGLDEHSPSKIMREDGAFAIQGFNLGLADEMPKTMDLIQVWMNNLNNGCNNFKLTMPWEDKAYTINREILDVFDTRASLSFDNSQYDFQVGITAELRAALADVIDYDKLGEAVYKAQSRAMQENPTKIGDDEIFNGVRRSQARFYKQTGKPGLIF